MDEKSSTCTMYEKYVQQFSWKTSKIKTVMKTGYTPTYTEEEQQNRTETENNT
jgi:hypothetical protein